MRLLEASLFRQAQSREVPVPSAAKKGFTQVFLETLEFQGLGICE